MQTTSGETGAEDELARLLSTAVPRAATGAIDFRLIADKSLSLIVVADHTGTIQYVNPTFCDSTGFSAAEVIGRKIHDLGELDARTLAELWDSLGFGQAWRGEFCTVKKNGDRFWVHASVSPITEDGRITHFLAVTLDVTERKRAEEALRASEENFRRFTESVPVATFIAQGSEFRFTNSAMEGVLGYAPAELAVMQFWEVVHPDHRDVVRERGMARQRGEELPSQIEVKFITKCGETRWGLCTAHQIEYAGDSAVIGTIIDITERKVAEEALRESEGRFRKLAETTTAATFIFDGARVRYANTAASNITGYSREELLSRNFWDIAQPDIHSETRERLQARALGEPVPPRAEVRITTRGGEARWVDFNSGFVELDGKEYVLGTAFDITARKLAEEALASSEEKFRTLVETIPAAVFIYQGTRVRFANRTTREVLGYSEEDLEGMSFWDVVHPDYRELARDRGLARQRGEEVPSNYEIRYLTRSGEDRWGLFAASMITYEGAPAVLGTVYDITERRHAEEAHHRSEERYRILYQDNPSMYFTLAEDLSVLSVNHHGAEQLGYTSEELVGEPVLLVVHPDDQTNVRRQLESLVLHRGARHGLEFRKVHKDGRTIWVKESVRVSHDVDGKRIVLVVCEDISERKQMEEAMQGLREELERKADRAVAGKNPYNLSFREITVLHLVTGGRSDKEIGVILGIRPQTVSKHVANVLKKMRASSRTEAGVRALREGLIT